jgi:hypothetical protein
MLEPIYKATQSHILQERNLNTEIVLQDSSVAVDSIHLAQDRTLDQWRSGIL